MGISSKIVRLAKYYGIDIYEFREQNPLPQNQKDDSNEIIANLPSSILLDIQEKFSAQTRFDGVFHYAKKVIKDKSQLPLLANGLNRILQHEMEVIQKAIEKNNESYNKICEEFPKMEKDDPILLKLDREKKDLESYQEKLELSLDFLDYRNHNPISENEPSDTNRVRKRKTAIQLTWVVEERSDRINTLYNILKKKSLGSTVTKGRFQKVYSGKPIDSSFKKVDWVHEGGRYSLCTFFYLLTTKHKLFQCSKLPHFIKLTFTVNKELVKTSTITPYFHRIQYDEESQYYKYFNQLICEVFKLPKDM